MLKRGECPFRNLVLSGCWRNEVFTSQTGTIPCATQAAFEETLLSKPCAKASTMKTYQHEIKQMMGVWHMPYTCTPYARHVYTLCRTRVRHMPDTHLPAKT